MNITRSQIRLFTIIPVLLFLVAACGPKNIMITIQNKAPLKSEPSETLIAGVARADITGPPGMPMAGHSMMAECAEGVRTRIKARVVYIKPKNGKPVALVQCDLQSGSRIIHHKVAELIAEKTDVEAGGLMIAGTHTHSAPGNFFGTVFYNKFASHKNGFAQNYYEFASRQIADAVIKACKSARPAKIATGTINIPGVTRSRSLKAYLNNDNISKENPPSALKAVNPEMFMIRIDCLDEDGAFRPVGAFSAFSIHPNVKNGDLDKFFNGDVFAYMEREVEWGIKEKYNTKIDPVHAAVNYTHGDNTANFKDIKLGFPEVKRIGMIVGKAAFSLFESLDSELKDDVDVMFRAKEIDLYEENSVNGIEICSRPTVGMALTGGGSDRPTPFLMHIPWFAPDWPKHFFKGGCQAEKRTIGSVFQRIILPKKIFPHNLFFQTFKIDDVVISALPFEVNYEAGNRIQKRVKESLSGKASKSIVISCANGYFGYVATPEEYARQHYEGGHTLYGPNTCQFLAEHLRNLASEMAETGSGSDLPEVWDFPLKKKNFYPDKYTRKGDREVYDGMPPVLIEKTEDKEPYWSFRWLDLPPAEIELHNPLVKVETSTDGVNWTTLKIKGRPVDDQGYDIAIRCVDDRKKGRGLYEARWYNPDPSCKDKKRFTILARKDQKELYSWPF